MILTVTANPSVDRTMFVDALPRGQVIRCRRSRREPSGKGVNVALALHGQGFGVTAVLPVGGFTGAELSTLLGATGLDTVEVAVAGNTRSNVSLVEPDGTVTKVNEPGPELTAGEVDALVRAVRDELTGLGDDGSSGEGAGGDWLVCCGSLPPGAPVDLYARLTALGRAAGVRVAVDTSGAPLRAALDAGPHLIKPNLSELAELVGSAPTTLGDVVEAARTVRVRGPLSVLVSLGADGAVLVGPAGVVHAEAAVRGVVNAVGAGDALLAGFLAAGGSGQEALAAAVSWAGTAVEQEGTVLGAVDHGRQVTLREHVEPTRRLREGPGVG